MRVEKEYEKRRSASREKRERRSASRDRENREGVRVEGSTSREKSASREM